MNDLVLINNIHGTSVGIGKPVAFHNTYAKAATVRKYEWKRFLLLGLESAIIYCTLTFFLGSAVTSSNYSGTTFHLITLTTCLVWWIIAFLPSHSYLKNNLSFKESTSFQNLWLPLFLHAGTSAFIFFTFTLPVDYSLMLLQYTVVLILLIGVRSLNQLSNRKGLNLKAGNFIIVSSPTYSQLLTRRLIDQWGENYLLKTFDPSILYNTDSISELASFQKYCLEHKVQYVFISLPAYEQQTILELTQFAAQHFIRCVALPTTGSIWPEHNNIRYVGNMIVYDLWQHPLHSKINNAFKRLFDILFSSLVILFVFSWLIPIIALAVKLSSPGPVFFAQKRPGKRNKLFKCLKFRTMRVNNQSEVQATFKDPRVTKVGTFLRKTSLDELPQFFNVLMGDMSIVGPRPNMVSQLEYYSQCIPDYPLRHAVAPGITGYAQVKGFRGETKELYLMEKRIELDLVYIRRWNFWFDIRIIFLTIRNMIAGEKYAY
jgi:putative colanic acid biosynthesis UDP-glucose lipid carrier transferase